MAYQVKFQYMKATLISAECKVFFYCFTLMKFYSILVYSFLIRTKHKKTRDPVFSLYSIQCRCGGFRGKREEGRVCRLLAATAHLRATCVHNTIMCKATIVWWGQWWQSQSHTEKVCGIPMPRYMATSRWTKAPVTNRNAEKPL